MISLPWLDEDTSGFPPVEAALRDPDGLLAVGGDLSPARLVQAYSLGIFPWYQEGEPILWWSPSLRMGLFPERLVVSRSMRKLLRKGEFEVTFDRAFARVIANCAAWRPERTATWITDDMQRAYCRLHELQIAHSVEVWRDGELVGGLYGVASGSLFFGESMFSLQSNASKIATIALARQLQRWGYRLIDCQIPSEHLASLGAQEITRADFQDMLLRYGHSGGKNGPWTMEPDILEC